MVEKKEKAVEEKVEEEQQGIRLDHGFIIGIQKGTNTLIVSPLGEENADREATPNEVTRLCFEALIYAMSDVISGNVVGKLVATGLLKPPQDSRIVNPNGMTVGKGPLGG